MVFDPMSTSVTDLSNPLVSLLIPVFNRENYLADCIRSALDQTWQNLEVIVVDNASTDGTWAICQEFAARDSRVRIFRNESNLGPVRNWLRCMEEGRGVFAKLLFSDDLMAPEFLERALPWMRDSEVGFVFSAIEVGDRPGAGGEPYRWRRSSGTRPGKTFIQESLLGGKVPLSPGAALFRLADLRKNLRLEIPTPAGTDFKRYGAGPDVLLYLLTAADYPKVAYIADPLTFFRSHPDSISIRENGGMIDSHYFQAKLWLASRLPAPRFSPFGSLLQMSLAYGWQRQARHGEGESLENFCRRHVGQSVRVGWPAKMGLRFHRFRMKCAKFFG